MASIQNEENASKELDFKTQTEDGKIRNPPIKEEFVKVIKSLKYQWKKYSSILFWRNIFQKPVQWQEYTATSTLCIHVLKKNIRFQNISS